MDVGLLSLATAVPPHKAAQRDVVASARIVFHDTFEDFDRLAPCSFQPGSRSAIRSSPFPGIWKRRTGRAAPRPISKARWRCSSTRRPRRWIRRIFTPGMSIRSSPYPRPASPRRAWRRAPWRSSAFRADVMRVPVFGLGCAGGAAGLWRSAPNWRRRAPARWCSWSPSSCARWRCGAIWRPRRIWWRWRCSATARPPRCSAPGRAGSQPIVEAWQHTWPDTLDIMGWRSTRWASA